MCLILQVSEEGNNYLAEQSDYYMSNPLNQLNSRKSYNGSNGSDQKRKHTQNERNKNQFLDKENVPSMNMAPRHHSKEQRGLGGHKIKPAKNGKISSGHAQGTPVRYPSQIVSSTPDLTKTVNKLNRSPLKADIGQIPAQHTISGESNITKTSGQVPKIKGGLQVQNTQNKPASTTENTKAYEDFLEILTENIGSQLSCLSQDPLMSVFREKPTTQEFMFTRLQEILMDCIKEANNEYSKKLMLKIQDQNNDLSQLKQLKRGLDTELLEIKNLTESDKRRYENLIEEKVKDFSSEIEGYKNMVNLVEGRRLELENELSNLKLKLEEQNNSTQDIQKQHTEEISNKNKKIEELQQEISDKMNQFNDLGSRLQQLSQKMKDYDQESRQKDAEKEQLLAKFAEMEKDYQKNENMGRVLAEELNSKIQACQTELKQERDKYYDLEQLMNSDNKFKNVMDKNKSLEEELDFKKDELDVYVLNLEESEFNASQLEVTVANLKNDLTDMS